MLYIGIAILIYLYGEQIMGWFRQSNNIGLVTFMAVIMALFPVIPYPLIGGVLGAAFGPVLGGLMTWVGSSVASLLMFLFVRYGYQEWGKKVLHGHKSVAKITEQFEKNAFLTITFARLLPFVPSFLINSYAALSRVSFRVYAIASSLGKIPAMLLFATVGDGLVREPRNIGITLGVYILFITLIIGVYRLWRRRAVRA